MKQKNHDMTLQQYKAALAAHDWYYQYSDDHGVWGRGRDQYQLISQGQLEHDHDFSIWNQHAPADMKVTVKL